MTSGPTDALSEVVAVVLSMYLCAVSFRLWLRSCMVRRKPLLTPTWLVLIDFCVQGMHQLQVSLRPTGKVS